MSFRDTFSQLATQFTAARKGHCAAQRELGQQQKEIKKLAREARALEEKKRREEKLRLKQQREAEIVARRIEKIRKPAKIVKIKKRGYYSLAHVQKLLTIWGITYNRVNKDNLLIPGANINLYISHAKVYGKLVIDGNIKKIIGLQAIKDFIYKYAAK